MLYIPFGKHQGQPLPEVPGDYLVWMLANCKLSGGFRQAVREELLSRGFAPAQLPTGPPPAPPPRCRRCGHDKLKVYWHQTGGGRRVRADCGRCAGHVQFLEHTDANRALADAGTRPAALLDALARAEEDGCEIVNANGYLTFRPYGRASAELKALVRQAAADLLNMLPRLPAGTAYW